MTRQRTRPERLLHETVGTSVLPRHLSHRHLHTHIFAYAKSCVNRLWIGRRHSQSSPWHLWSTSSSTAVEILLLGKIVGNTLMALGQMVVFAAFGVIGLLTMGKSDILEQITPGFGWFFLFYGVLRNGQAFDRSPDSMATLPVSTAER